MDTSFGDPTLFGNKTSVTYDSSEVLNKGLSEPNEHNTDQEQNQKQIDALTSDLKTRPWKGELNFDIEVDGQEIKDYNIFDTYFHRMNKNGQPGLKVYLDPKKYKPCKKGFDGDDWAELCTALKKEANEKGYQLFIGESESKKKQQQPYRKLKCTCGSVYHSQQCFVLAPNYRKTTAHNDRKNTRGPHGQSMVRRTNTKKPRKKENECPFQITVAFDNHGFYLKGGSDTHQNHAKVKDPKLTLQGKHLSNKDKDDIRELHEIGGNFGLCQNLVYKRQRVMLSRESMRYIAGLSKKLKDMEKKQELYGQAEKIIDTLENDDVLYYCLVQKAGENSKPAELVSGVYKKDDKNISGEIVDLEEKENLDATDYLNKHRKKLRVKDDQDLMVAHAWILQKELQMLMKHPFVLFVDTIKKTNKENKSLLTISGKTASGKMYPILRAFVPNERAWIFKWIFSVVLPSIIPAETRAKIYIIISDGDSAEISQLQHAIEVFLENCKRLRCGWHIVNRGFIKYVPKTYAKSDTKGKELYDHIAGDIQGWLYSWMSSDCETQEEYEISFKLLELYLDSEFVKSQFGNMFVNAVKEFITGHVEPHATDFLFYLRKDILHFEEWTNSCQEGTNAGIRFSAAPLLPSHSVEVATQILTSNAHRKIDMLNKQMHDELLSTKTDSNWSCGDHLIRRCDDVAYKQWELRFEYDIIRISVNEWLLRTRLVHEYAGDGGYWERKYQMLWPHFIRVRKVWIAGRYFFCSCCFFQRWGFGCRHIWSVLTKEHPEYEPTHHDFRVFWWKIYNANDFFETSTDPQIEMINQSLRNLWENDILGPAVPAGFCPKSEIVKDIPEKFEFGKLRCANYDLNEFKNDQSQSIGQPLGMVQVTNNRSNNRSCMNSYFAKSMKNSEMNKSLKRSGFVWDELSPKFKEAVELLEESINRDLHISNMNKYFNEVCSTCREESHCNVSSSVRSDASKSNIASLSVPMTKKRRHTPHKFNSL